jgi:hypothetical protein
MSPLPFQQADAGTFGLLKAPRGQAGGLMVALACVFLSALPGCGNPSFDVLIERLEPDPPGVVPGPDHRPGQPCLLCHGPYKGASPQMSVAGTIFKAPATAGEMNPKGETLSNVNVKVFDADGKLNGLGENDTKVAKLLSGMPYRTNDPLKGGNFFFEADGDNAFKPSFPLNAQIECSTSTGGTVQFTMVGRISREGSCNYCHQGAKSQQSPGWIECQFP